MAAQVSIESVLAEYKTYLENTTYELLITKAALKDAERQLAERDAEANRPPIDNS